MENNIQPKDEIRSLTGLRGIAALFVVLYHAFHRGTPFGFLLERGYLCVDLFFVLSGFVMALNYGGMFANNFSLRNYLKFLGLRFARIYPVYVVLLIAVVGLHLAGLMPIFDVPDLGSALLWNATMLQSISFGAGNINGPAWSISTEWFAYLVFPGLVAVMSSRSAFIYWGGAVVAIILLSTIWLFAPSMQPSSAGLDGPIGVFSTETLLPVLRCVGGFTLGLLCYRVMNERTGDWLSARPIAGDVAAIFICLFFLIPQTDILLVICSALLITHLARGRSVTSDMLGHATVYWLGVISYSMYLVHVPIILSLRTVARWYDLPGVLPNIAGVVLTILVAPVTYKLIELPGRTFLRAAMRSRRRLALSQ